MKPIKFRARDEHGNVFFGSYDQSTATIDDFEYAETHVVNENTVAQLVAYDSNGAEIYEGDTVVDQNGTEYVAELCPCLKNSRNGVVKREYEFGSVTLKKEADT